VLRIRCRGNVLTEPLNRNDNGIHIETDRREKFMKYVVRMVLDVMIYVHTSFIQTCLSIQKLILGIHRQHCGSISLLLFSLNN
jgi:hypothetical protein